jgi:hypothetical protein
LLKLPDFLICCNLTGETNGKVFKEERSENSMKVCAIKQNCDKEDFERFKTKLAYAIKIKSDIIIGPYGSLGRGLSSKQTKTEVYDSISSLSSGTNSLILPGTIFYEINETEAVCEAPLFHRGSLIKNFHKEKDNGLGNLAEQNGYIYKRGDNSKNNFEIRGRKIAVELCGDHGIQDATGCDLELILAYDSRAGFWISAFNDDFSRFAVVCDGRAPKVECFRYDHINPVHKMGIIRGRQLNNNVSLFDLNERNVHYA